MTNSRSPAEQKVLELFTELAGDRAHRLDPSVLSTPAIDALGGALSEEYGIERADQIALNLADWNWEAAFLVALHLYPERFTPDEIREGVLTFMVHVPDHIREFCRLVEGGE